MKEKPNFEAALSFSDLELLSGIAIHHAFYIFLTESPLSPALFTLKDKVLDRLRKIEEESENDDLNDLFDNFRLYFNKIKTPIVESKDEAIVTKHFGELNG